MTERSLKRMMSMKADTSYLTQNAIASLEPRFFPNLNKFLWTPRGFALHMLLLGGAATFLVNLKHSTVQWAAHYNWNYQPDVFLFYSNCSSFENCPPDVQRLITDAVLYIAFNIAIYVTMVATFLLTLFAYWWKGNFVCKDSETLLADFFYGFPGGSVMVSYCWSDDTQVPRAVARYFPCRWLDIERLIPGSVVKESCRQAARNSVFRVMFVSERYLKSGNCQVEYEEIVKFPGASFIFAYPDTPEEELTKLRGMGHIVYELADVPNASLPASFLLQEMIKHRVFNNLLSQHTPGINNQYSATAAALLRRRSIFPLFAFQHLLFVLFLTYLFVAAPRDYVCVSAQVDCRAMGATQQLVVTNASYVDYDCPQRTKYYSETEDQIGVLAGVCADSIGAVRVFANVVTALLLLCELFCCIVQYTTSFRSFRWRRHVPDIGMLLIVLKQLGITQTLPYCANVGVHPDCMRILKQTGVIRECSADTIDGCCGCLLVEELTVRPSIRAVASGTFVFWTRQSVAHMTRAYRELLRNCQVSAGQPDLEAILCRLLMFALDCPASALTMGTSKFRTLQMGTSKNVLAKGAHLLIDGANTAATLVQSHAKDAVANARDAMDRLRGASAKEGMSPEEAAFDRARELLRLAVIRFQIRKYEQLDFLRRQARRQTFAGGAPSPQNSRALLV